jgi:hypothetical protein
MDDFWVSKENSKEDFRTQRTQKLRKGRKKEMQKNQKILETRFHQWI